MPNVPKDEPNVENNVSNVFTTLDPLQNGDVSNRLSTFCVAGNALSSRFFPSNSSRLFRVVQPPNLNQILNLPDQQAQQQQGVFPLCAFEPYRKTHTWCFTITEIRSDKDDASF